ncbi:MAG: LamG domain-containing protein [Lentisphaeria bacterium]|nr:LamG domain-containing protein [Lentisphaeria bacterium]
MLPRTMFFTQAQLKYTLNPNCNGTVYYSHWTDWPLFIDSALKEADRTYRGLQYPDYVRMQEVMRQYGLDGIVYWQYFIRNKTRSDIVEFSARSKVPGFYHIPQLCGDFDLDKDAPPILASPQTLRINGKAVIQCYGIRTDQALREAREKFREKYADQFLFIMRKAPSPSIRKRFHVYGGKFSREDRQELENEIRASLQIADGFGWWNIPTICEVNKGRRIFDVQFYRALMNLTGKVMAEPQFKEKLLVAEAAVGHENASRVGQIMSSAGTRGLRDTLIPALENGADIVTIPEWDEQNENTSLRPTVFNGTSHLRLMRHIIGLSRGEPFPRLPGDDPRRPNLILSTRKVVSLGELLEFELLNLPDAEESAPFTVQLNLRDINGKLLHAFPPFRFDDKAMQEHRPVLPSEMFAAERVLLPELVITRNGQTARYAEGLWAVQVLPTWNSDYKWVKQPLRDLMDTPEVRFTAVRTQEPNMLRAEAAIRAREPLSFAEVLDCGDCIFSAGAPDETSWRETDSHLVFRVGTQSLTVQNLTGTVTLENTSAQWKGQPGRLDYRNYHTSLWHRGDWVRMPRKDMEQAVFNINFPGHIVRRVPVREVMDRHNIVLGGKKGFNLTLTRQLRQYFHPRNLRRNAVDFTMEFSPDLHNSAIQLQLVAQSGRIWRSKPILTGRASTETARITVYSETEEKPVDVSIPADALPRLEYAPDTRRGLILPVAYGRRMWGIRGGFTDLACMRLCGGDSSVNGVPCSWHVGNRLWSQVDDLVPEAVPQEDGSVAFKFRGDGSHFSLPQGAIPRRSGFTVSFDIRPEDTRRKQYILSCRGTLPGAFDHLWIENGTLHLCHVSNQIRSSVHDSRIPLTPSRWNRVKVSYDLRNFTVEVNGIESGKLPADGPGLYDTATMVGTWDKQPFTGLIRNFRIVHQPDAAWESSSREHPESGKQ